MINKSPAINDPQRPATWTDDQAFAHLSETFRRACRTFPDIMEPWIIRIGDLIERADEVAMMRKALSETINERFPLERDKA